MCSTSIDSLLYFIYFYIFSDEYISIAIRMKFKMLWIIVIKKRVLDTCFLHSEVRSTDNVCITPNTQP